MIACTIPQSLSGIQALDTICPFRGVALHSHSHSRDNRAQQLARDRSGAPDNGALRFLG
jgi:hypothetical protein